MRNLSLENRARSVCIAALALLAFYLLSLSVGCDEPCGGCDPGRKCCPGGCKPAIQDMWFSAEWCGPCKRQAPEVARAVAGYNFLKVDIDAKPELARLHNVRSVPTYIVIVNGRERARTQNAMELRDLLGR